MHIALSRFFLLIASLLAGLALQSPLPASAQPSGDDKAASTLVGRWEEFTPSSNIVEFVADGTIKLYLTKGEVGTLHTLDGTWKMEDGDSVRMVFSVDGRTLARTAKLSFSGQEMVLTDGGGRQSKHRRHSGKLPDKYVW